MPYNSDSFHINFVVNFLQDKCTFWRKTAIWLFVSPLPSPVGGLQATLLFIFKAWWKARSGLPISHTHNWTVFARCYGLGSRSRYRLKIGISDAMGSVWPIISGRRGCPPPTILPVRKLDEWAFIRYKNFSRSFFHFIASLVIDRRTFCSWLILPCIVCKAVKMCSYSNTDNHWLTWERFIGRCHTFFIIQIAAWTSQR